MTAIFFFIDALLGAYALAIIISIIISWLVSFGIINSYQPFVQAVSRTLYAITEPALSRIRRFLPDLGGIDISPLILYFAVYAVRILLRADIAPLFGVYGY
ncbi:YggT family protein [Kordiimonas aquimaris]|uniref:YggT family protein n=1 Tax=Kordiimonas aquimaris TaxID=707591 RepID=UPI0021D34B4E|nr:YggT family protein [Kordiimonas aquimaris]